MARKNGVASRQRGLNLQPDTRAEKELMRAYARLDRAALAAAQRLLPNAAVNGQSALENAIRQIQAEASEALTDDDIDAASSKAASKQNKRHEAMFFAGLGAAIGIPIIGGDSMARPRVPVASLKRKGRVLIPRQSAAPQAATDAFVERNRFYIGRVREGIATGLQDAIRNEGKLLGRKLSKEDMDGLVSQWRQGGVPSWIPQNRARRDGERVLISVKKHANMIAADQIETHNADLTLSRQTNAGLREFVWESMQDSAVRPKHRIWQSRVFDWATGAPGGIYPGDEPRCRCWARAVVNKQNVLRFGFFNDVDLTQEIPDRPLPFAAGNAPSDPSVFGEFGRVPGASL